MLEDLGTTVFNSARQLIGDGIVVIRGDVIINQGSSSLFSGVLYVEGNLAVHAPAQLRGSVVVTGDLTIQGVGDYDFVPLV